tara:strand:+ start:530 stop:1042 length:513 start_codon:yes stop_codon:yes gene_type:complete
MSTNKKYRYYVTSFHNGFHVQTITNNDTGTDNLWIPKGRWREDQRGNWKRCKKGIIRDSYDDWEDYWNMQKIEWGPYNLWKCGYINEREETTRKSWEDEPYWWCRHGDWLPFWGESTILRAKLLKEIDNYWLKKRIEKQYNNFIILCQWNKCIPTEIIKLIMSNISKEDM